MPWLMVIGSSPTRDGAAVALKSHSYTCLTEDARKTLTEKLKVTTVALARTPSAVPTIFEAESGNCRILAAQKGIVETL
jgi:hypothetical protein